MFNFQFPGGVQFLMNAASFSAGYQPQILGDMQDLEEVQLMNKGIAERKCRKRHCGKKIM